jgi:hypothetical protein
MQPRDRTEHLPHQHRDFVRNHRAGDHMRRHFPAA